MRRARARSGATALLAIAASALVLLAPSASAISLPVVWASVVKDINPGPSSGWPREFVTVDDTLYFFAYNGLWRSDGTAAGTTMVKAFAPGMDGYGKVRHGLARVGNRLFFTDDYAGGLWKSDGTEAGTTPVFPSGGGPTNILSITDLNGIAYFSANGGPPLYKHGFWRSDGTAAGTFVVKDIFPGEDSNPTYLTAFGGKLYFAATDGVHGNELWRSDGTEAGTVLVKDFLPGDKGSDSNPQSLQNIAGALYLVAPYVTAGAYHAKALWRIDTGAGPVLVKDFYPGSVGGPFIVHQVWDVPLAEFKGWLYLQASDGTSGYELWRTDGTEAGTSMVADINPSGDSFAEGFTPVGDTLYFQADDGVHGPELWRTDGTAGGTLLVKDLYPGSTGSYPAGLFGADGRVLFTAGPYEDKLWSSDGVDVTEITPGPLGTLEDEPGPGIRWGPEFHRVGQRVLFHALDQDHGSELWQLDGPLNPTAVTLLSFEARRVSDRVGLRWRMASAGRLAGFHLYRRAAREWVRLDGATIPAAFGSDTRHVYSFVDRSPPLGRLTYRLQAVRLDGTRIWLGTTRVSPR